MLSSRVVVPDEWHFITRLGFREFGINLEIAKQKIGINLSGKEYVENTDFMSGVKSNLLIGRGGINLQQAQKSAAF